MSRIDGTPEKAVVLWLSGARLADIRSLPEVKMLLNTGALVELESLPITGQQAQSYQVFTGRSPASFGFFDTLMPHNYTIKEEMVGRGDTPNGLPDLLRTVGWSVNYEEIQPSELVMCMQSWARTTANLRSCLIIKCPAMAELPDVSQALQIARTTIGESGLLALFSETQPVAVERFVNMNNFLAEMGVIERDEQSGLVNWSNSLAYYAGHGQLWLNLLGRDSHGVVHPNVEYEEVRDTLVKALPNKLRDPETGALVIEQVYRKEKLYSGDYLFCAPDLVVVFKPGYAPSPRSTRLDFDEGIFTTPVVGTTTLAGIHPSMPGGFLLASAQTLASAVQAAEHAPLVAVVPTLLHALMVEYADLESPAIRDVFSPSYLETHPIRSGMQNQELSEEDEELIISHLRDLGYV